MAGLFGGNQGQATNATILNAIQISQSNYGNCVPYVCGQTRIPTTLLWYGDFLATPHTDSSSSGGKGGGGGSGSTSYTYSAALILGLCEGPLYSIDLAYSDNSQADPKTDPVQLSFTLKAGTGGQTPWSYLLGAHANQAVPYDHTAYLCSSAYQLGSSAALPNTSFEITGRIPYSVANGIRDAACAAILTDYCTDANAGAGFPYLDNGISGAGNTFHQYAMAMGFVLSPAETSQRPASDFISEICEITNAAPVWGSDGVLRIIPHVDENVASLQGGVTYSYNPNMSPEFDLTDEDYIDQDDGSPVMLTRTPTSERYNKIRVEYLNRANAYNVDIAEASDAADIAINGERVMSTLTYHSITTSATARLAAQLRLQRELYVVNTYTVIVRAEYSLLEPMDLVTLTDKTLGLTRKLVRIIQVDESTDDQITLTCEEVPIGNANAPIYNWADAAGYQANYAVLPGSVAAPTIFSAPPLLISSAVNGGYELWIAITGLDPNWGGCSAWTSFDDTTYKKIGVLRAPARYGSLVNALPSATDPDRTSTLSVLMLQPTMQLIGGTQADADNAHTLIYVDGEIMSFESAALVGNSRYDLTYLRRGLYGSHNTTHGAGTPFVRCDDRLFKVPLDSGNLGDTVYFKFTSFNIFGTAEQSLSQAIAYSKVLEAAVLPLPVGPQGDSVYVQYAATIDGVWHDPPFIDGKDFFMRVKTGIDGVWSVGFRIVGTDGTAGIDALSLTINNSTMIVVCYADGTPGDPTFVGNEGWMTLISGQQSVMADAALTIYGKDCAGIINTDNNVPYPGQPKGYYRLTDLVADTATLTLSATWEGQSLSAVVTVTKMMGGYSIEAALPVTNLFEGRVIVLKTDGKLYRYVSGEWTAEVSALDITGLLTDAQIATLAASKIIGQIKGTQIADGGITTPKLAAGSVVASTIAAGSITGDRLVGQTITGDKIAGNTIAAGSLQAHSITADQLSSGQLITGTAQIGNGVIVSANIGALQVQSANIANLTVGTEKITGNAVSTSASASAGAYHGTPAGYTTCVSVAITTAGGAVNVLAIQSCVLAPGKTGSAVTLSSRLLRDGVVIDACSTTLMGGDSAGTPRHVLAALDYPGAGWHNYQVQIVPSGSSGSSYSSASIITVTELKK